MKKNVLSAFGLRCLSLCLSLLLCISLFPFTVCGDDEADSADDAYIAPAYVVDFSTYDGIDRCSGLFHVTTSLRDGAMRVGFEDNGGGMCDDPYMTLALPDGVDCTVYHYLALIVRTDKQDLRGEVRFRTASTGGDYPCQFFNYQSTDDWQLVVLDLTDKSTVQYAPPSITFTGSFTNLRLDMFNNSCPTDTAYDIKAYGLYDNREDAATFINYVTVAEQEKPEEPEVDYASFWRGEAFQSPAPSTRMRWVTYGFSDASPIDTFLRQGFGGVVSNVKFNSNYLLDDSEFRILATVYRYAAEHGMSAWIYDEYQWPSGKAFGQVLEGHDEYQATGVEHRILTGQGGVASYECSGVDIRILQADLTDGSGTRSLPVTDGKVSANASGEWTLDVYVLRYTYEGVEDPSDFTTLRHVDLLNKDAVARFISLTHQRYFDKMGEDFDLVEAFFTDEPQLGNRGKVGYAVWTDGLDQIFLDTFGYEINLPSLFSGDSEADRLCRMNYFQLVARLFKEAYIDQISAWCEAHGVASSGHLLFEENMNDQIETYGGDFLQIVGGMTIPGVDLLWVDPAHLLSKNHIGSVVGIRYVASAAKNAGKDRVMVEFNPDAAGALSDTDPLGECIGGVSVSRLLGTTDYNMINPQFSLTSSEYDTLNTYVGRLNTLLSDAQECGQLALFYPIATVQALHDADTGHTSETGKQSAAITLDERFQTICRNLLLSQFMYTVIDDASLRAATVASDGCLCIGNGAYRAVILPMTQYISVEAMEKLVIFKKAGGTVIFVGDTPVHGLNSGEDEVIRTLMAKLEGSPAYSVSGRTLYNDLDQYVTRALTVSASSGSQMAKLLMGDFETADKDISYLVNTGTDAVTYTFHYTDGYQGTVTVYSPLSGMIQTLTLDGTDAEVTIPGYEAVLIVRDDVNDHMSQHTPYIPEQESESESESESISVPDDTTGTVTDTDAATPQTDPATKPSVESTPTEEKGCASLLAGGMLLPILSLSVLCLYKKKKVNE